MSILFKFFVDNMHTIAMVSMLIVCSLSLLVAIGEAVDVHRLHKENERLKKELKEWTKF